VSLRRVLVRHSRFLVYGLALRGAVIEDRLIPEVFRFTRAGWPTLTLLLGGRAVVRSARVDAEVEGGQAVWTAAGAGYTARSDLGGTEALFVQWDPQIFGDAGNADLDSRALVPAEMAELRRCMAAFLAGGPETARAASCAFLALLRQHGWMRECVDVADLLAPVPEEVVRAGLAMDTVLSRLEERPACVDLEQILGCSSAHVRRLADRLGGYLDLPGTRSWREQLRSWRLNSALTLMSAVGASTEGVARVVGFGSATAMCHAFASVGLPSPGRIVGALARVR
jgi:AraC-like DNA-binding protein